MTTSVIDELNKTIAVLEAVIPANQSSPKNQTLKNRLRRDMAKYFNDWEKAFPYSAMAGLYSKYVEKE